MSSEGRSRYGLAPRHRQGTWVDCSHKVSWSFRNKDTRSLSYYFSTQGCSRVWSSLLSEGFCFALLAAAAAAAARALLLKKLAAISGCISGIWFEDDFDS